MLIAYYSPRILFTSLSCLLLAFITCVARYIAAARRPKKFPPGPPTLPFIGNLHQVNPTRCFLQFQQWGRQYGSILGVKFGPQDVVVLNNWRHVRELIDRRGGIYSSRLANHIGNELLFPNETHVLLQPYGPSWRAMRRTTHALLNVNAVANILPLQNAEAAQTAFQILADPAEYYEHVKGYTTAVILGAVYGQRRDADKIARIYEFQERFTRLMEPGAAPPVDDFPFLKYVPECMAWWAKEARQVREGMRALYGQLLSETKERMQRGVLKGCFMERMIEEQHKFGLTDEQVMYLGGAFMEAGSDTTSSALLSFLLACLKWPRVLKKCQEEVDKVCGTDRSPNVGDLDRFPYIEACMREVLRWRPITPGSVPHVLTQDDVYDDYVLKKGTMVMINVWAIERDPNEYDRPDEFMPERFLSNKFGTKPGYAVEQDDHRRTSYGFGAGRRQCPGQTLAINSMILNIAKLCWAFNMKAPGPVNVDIETAYSIGFAIRPKKFPMIMTPRSEKHAAIITQDWKEASAYLERYTDLDMTADDRKDATQETDFD